MKKIKIYLAFFSIVCLLFSSCSKEGDSPLADDPANKGALTFGAFLNDLLAKESALKQGVTNGLPACSDDAPAFVEVVLSQGNEPVVGSLGNPLRVRVNPDPQDYDEDGEAEYFTEESNSLELFPGTYTLVYFTVLNASGEEIWVAPVDNGQPGNFADFVDSPLPMDIELGAGVKKYVDVEVLCFDDRDVNEYGYQYFDIEENEAFEFCFFANYCPPSGMHFPAAISVDIWIGEDGSGMPFYSDETNTLGRTEDGDRFASPICFALPNLDEFADDEDYIYYEVTLLDWVDAYGDVEQTVISGNLSRNDIIANFDGPDRVDYEHLRFGCEEDLPNEDCPGDGDCDEVPDDQDQCPDSDDNADEDGDGIPDACDACPEDASNGCNDEEDSLEGCETAYMKADHDFIEDMDFKDNKWGWAEEWTPADGDGPRTFEFWAAAGQSDTDKGIHVGNVTIEIDGEEAEITLDMFEDYDLRKVHIYLDGDVPTKSAPGKYDYKGDDLSYRLDIDDFDEGETFWVIVHGEVCGEED